MSFFDNGDLSAIIDFYFSCNDFYAYDLAITINAWCFNENNEFSTSKLSALMNAYMKVRALSLEEKQALNTLCRGAAFRILLSRLEEFFMYDPNIMDMTPHDPGAYLKRLQFHRSKDVFREFT